MDSTTLLANGQNGVVPFNNCDISVAQDGTLMAPQVVPLIAKTLTPGRVTVGATATQIAPQRLWRDACRITLLAAGEIFIGAAGVTAATGDLFAGNRGSWIAVAGGAAIFAVVASSTLNISITELLL